MTRSADLKLNEKVIYFGFAFPSRRGNLCKVNAISENEDVVVIFDSDKLCTSCKAAQLRVAEDGA